MLPCSKNYALNVLNLEAMNSYYLTATPLRAFSDLNHLEIFPIGINNKVSFCYNIHVEIMSIG